MSDIIKAAVSIVGISAIGAATIMVLGSKHVMPREPPTFTSLFCFTAALFAGFFAIVSGLLWLWDL